jgi:hypothetical protein
MVSIITTIITIGYSAVNGRGFTDHTLDADTGEDCTLHGTSDVLSSSWRTLPAPVPPTLAASRSVQHASLAVEAVAA